MTKHPTQPVIMDANGVHRFKRNTIISHLYSIGKIDLNAIACEQFPIEDRRQLAQLLGYSVSGYGELSYTAGCSARYATPDATPEDLDQERRQELHDAAKAARESLDTFTHLIEIAEGTL